MPALLPPLEPMLAQLERTLPSGDDLLYEPKWDGFRCLAFCSGGAVALHSRNNRPLTRYFPEVVGGLWPLGDVVLDKVKQLRTDCVVGGVRIDPDGGVRSLLLGAYDGDVLRHVGVASSFARARRAELRAELSPLATGLLGHPSEHGFGLEEGNEATLTFELGDVPERLERHGDPFAGLLSVEQRLNL